jgi:hypothetical protein
LTKSWKFAPKKITIGKKNHCWHYVKNPLYLWIFSILNSKSSTTNNHFKLGEFFLYMHVYAHTYHIYMEFFFEELDLSKDVHEYFTLSSWFWHHSSDICENLYNKSSGILCLCIYLFGSSKPTYFLSPPHFFEYEFFWSNNSPPKQYASQLNMNVAWMFLRTINSCIIERMTRFENKFVKESFRQFLTFLSNHKWLGQINEHVPCTCLISSCLDKCSRFLRNFILAYWKPILSMVGVKSPKFEINYLMT